MRMSTQVNKIMAAKVAMRDVLGVAAISNPTANTLWDRLHNLVDPKLPYHSREYLRGYKEALLEAFEFEYVCARYFIDGQYYSILNDKKFPDLSDAPIEVRRKAGPNNIASYYTISNKPYHVHKDHETETPTASKVL